MLWAPFILAGCGAPIAFQVASLFADGVSLDEAFSCPRAGLSSDPGGECPPGREQRLSGQFAEAGEGVFGVLVADECFPGDTPISTPDGPIPIKDIKVGELVLSYKAGTVVARRVVRTIVRPRRSQLMRVTHSRGHITCTPNHKIYVDGQFVQAEHLAPNDSLTVLSDDTIREDSCVVSVEFVDSDDDLVYNLEVEDTHCYFAADVERSYDRSVERFIRARTDR